MASRLFQRMLSATEAGAFPGMRRFAWKAGYNILSLSWRRPRWRFLNFGYLPQGEPFPLAAEDEAERAFIGLYHQAADGLPLAGARVLEVGCGHGGGSAWLARSSGAAWVTGVDISAATLRHACRLNADVPRLDLRRGDAEHLPFPDAAFDVVVNIESSHCYGRMDHFAAEVGRVLRPGGWFTWADMRTPAMLPELDRAFATAPLALRAETRINAEVLAALDAMETEKSREIKPFFPVRPLLREFAGMRGSLLHQGLGSGAVLYLARRYQRV